MSQNADSIGAVDADQVFGDLAIQYGLLRPGGPPVGDDLWDYTMAVVTLCARIADAHDPTERGGPPGESIRAALLNYRNH